MIETRWLSDVFYIPPKAKGWFTEQQKAKLEALYPTAPKEEILTAFPNHSWEAIVQRAVVLKIRRRGKHLSKCV